MTAISRSLSRYLDEVASAAPTPGGGSVVAIVGALGAALGEMVVHLTSEPERHEGEAAALKAAGARLSALRHSLAGAAAADERAYAAYRDAAAMPRGNAEEKLARKDAMQDALIAASDVPLAVAKAATATAEVMIDVARYGNPHLRSDAALGALLAEVTLRGALLNVRGNAALLRDKNRAANYLAEADRLEDAGREAAERAFQLATGGT